MKKAVTLGKLIKRFRQWEDRCIAEEGFGDFWRMDVLSWR